MRRATLLLLIVMALVAAACPPALAACCLESDRADCRDAGCDPDAECCRNRPAPDAGGAPDSPALPDPSPALALPGASHPDGAIAAGAAKTGSTALARPLPARPAVDLAILRV